MYGARFWGDVFVSDAKIAQEVGRLIRRRRRRIGVSQLHLAELLGNSAQSRISAYELGIKGPSLETLYRLSDALRCSIHDLIPKERP